MFKSLFFGRSISVFLVVGLLFIETGCYRGYYKLSPVEYEEDGTLTLKRLNRVKVDYNFVHIGNKVIQLDSLGFDETTQIFVGKEVPIDSVAYSAYEKVENDGRPTSKRNLETEGFRQLHFFVSEFEQEDFSEVSFRTSDVLETQVMKNASGTNIAAKTAVVTIHVGVPFALLIGAWAYGW